MLRSSALLVLLALPINAPADDWPMWGRDESRRMAAADGSLPTEIAPGQLKGARGEVDASTARNLKWVAKLGSQTYGNPTVAGGRVYVGTNNDYPRDPRIKGDRGCVYCFDEATGALLWQLVVPKLGTGMVSDWEYVGICSSPSIEGDRVYLVTNRCEVICLDAKGLADGNDGAFQDEGRYAAGPEGEPLPPAETDADILWVFDMRAQCGVHPHNITSSSVLVADGYLWVTTSNGMDLDGLKMPAPDAPSLIVLDKSNGRYVARETSGISARTFHACWTSPAYLRRPEGDLCIFGGPDGFCYAFASDIEEREDGPAALREVWRTDCNPADLREKDGKPVPYSSPRGPSEILATPVVADGWIYCAIGQEPDYCDGPGHLVCLDGNGKVVWSSRKLHRTMSTPAVTDGMVHAADHAGFLRCLDAKTGEELWVHDTMGSIWGSPLVAGGRVWLGNEDGFLTTVPLGRKYEAGKVVEVDFSAPLYSSPVAANGVLYVTTMDHLYAFVEETE